MKIFAGAIYGYKSGELNIIPFATTAENKRQAHGIAVETNEKHHPNKDGWTNVGHVLTEISDKLLNQVG